MKGGVRDEAQFYRWLTPFTHKARLKRESLPLEERKHLDSPVNGHRMKTLVSVFVSLVMLLGMVPVSPVLAAVSSGSPGEVEINKTAVMSGDRLYDVTLTASGVPIAGSDSDIVLVVDVSASMDTILVGSSSRLAVLKSAASTFVSTVLASGNNRVALVEYSTDVTGGTNWNDGRIVQAFSGNAATVNGAISGLHSENYTNIEAGFYHADAALDAARAGVDTIVVFMTDGLPNRHYNSTGGTVSTGDHTGEAIGAAEALKANHPGTKIFTIGLNSTPADQDEMEAVLNPDPPHDYPAAFYSVTSADGLSAIYAQLSTTIFQIATSAVVTDIIKDGFVLVPGSLSYPASTSVHVTGSPPATETITWTIGSIDNSPVTLTYQLYAEDPVYGAPYTNQSAEIVFKPVAANPFYTPDPNGYSGETFPLPIVPVPPIAIDDSYSVNMGDVLTVPAAGVLVNDLSVDQRADGGWTSTPISGSVTVVSGPSHGILVQDADGKLTYTPAPGFSGIDTYVYKIFTDVTIAGGGTTRLEDTATVTIDVKTAISVTKVWKDEGPVSRPASITFHLWRSVSGNPAVEVDSKTVSDPWTYTFIGLDTQNPQGQPYTYSVTEDAVPHYSTSVDGFTVINTRSGLVDIPVTKVWKDDGPATRPASITFHLWRSSDGDPAVECASETVSGPWDYTFAAMDLYDPDGHLYTYSVTEDAVPNYNTSIVGFTVTNTLNGLIGIPVTKVWKDDGPAARPASITFHLWRSVGSNPAVECDSETVSGPWNYTFAAMDKYNPDGHLYTYSVTEDAVPNYNTSIVGFTVTNTLNGLVDIPVTKVWKDDGPATRPASITFRLWRSVGSNPVAECDSETVSGPWDYTFAAMDKYDPDGHLFTYSVTEDAVPNYNMSIVGFTVTNILTGLVDIPVTKVWVDDGPATRPASITFHLWRSSDGNPAAECDSETVSGPWDYTFAAMDKYDPDGHLYTYSITEDLVPDYSTSINGFEVTNTSFELAGITIAKLAQNLTQSGVPAELAVGYSGDLFRYTVTITNSGIFDLTEVILTDDKAEVGDPVFNATDHIDLIWQAGVGSIATVSVGDLAVGESVSFTYNYTSSDADIDNVLVNTAAAEGIVAISVERQSLFGVGDSDEATVIVDEIPQSGETGTSANIGWMLLIAAAILLFIQRRRFFRKIKPN
jgi:hypothetical protein